MKLRVFHIFVSTLCMFLFFIQSIQAAGRPDVTRHEAQFLGGALNMQIEWQSPNPVVLIKISIANIQKEIKVDAYDNRRNRDGYAGEVNFTLNIEGTPSEPFPYVLQLEDELRIKSRLTRGKVKISSSQPVVIFQPQQPSIQIQIQQNFPQAGIPQSNIPPYVEPGVQPGQQPYVQPGASPGMTPGVLPGAQSGSQQVGSLIVIISPLMAAEGGAMWRAGNGPWKRGGEAIPDLPVGIHTIEFQDLGDWIKPEIQKVMIEGGQTHTINGFYNSR